MKKRIFVGSTALCVFVWNDALAGMGADRYALDPDGNSSVIFPIFLIAGLLCFFAYALVRDTFRSNTSPDLSRQFSYQPIPKPELSFEQTQGILFQYIKKDVFLRAVGLPTDLVVNNGFSELGIRNWEKFTRTHPISNEESIDCARFMYARVLFDIHFKNGKAQKCVRNSADDYIDKYFSEKGLKPMRWLDSERQIEWSLTNCKGTYYLHAETTVKSPDESCQIDGCWVDADYD